MDLKTAVFLCKSSRRDSPGFWFAPAVRMTIAQSATSIASAVNEKDISYLQAQQKHLQAILERIAMANELDLEHLKEVMRRSEQTLQTVSDIVQESVQANVAILSGNPAMA